MMAAVKSLIMYCPQSTRMSTDIPYLKGTVSRDCRPFLVNKTLPGSDMNRLTRFCESFLFVKIFAKW